MSKLADRPSGHPNGCRDAGWKPGRSARRRPELRTYDVESSTTPPSTASTGPRRPNSSTITELPTCRRSSTTRRGGCASIASWSMSAHDRAAAGSYNTYGMITVQYRFLFYGSGVPLVPLSREDTNERFLASGCPLGPSHCCLLSSPHQQRTTCTQSTGGHLPRYRPWTFARSLAVTAKAPRP